MDYINVTYPKFKMGEEVVREVAVPPTYGIYCYLVYLKTLVEIIMLICYVHSTLPYLLRQCVMDTAFNSTLKQKL